MTATVYRWEFRRQEVARRVYAEGELANRGRPGDPTWMFEVYLVRDEMRQPDAKAKRVLIDPEARVGNRVYVGIVSSRDDDRVRLLAYLAPVEGERLAYSVIWDCLREHPDHVARFGDEWLAETMAEMAGKS